MPKLNCILLIDDDEEDNFFHSLVINEMDLSDHIEIAENGLHALDYLENGDCVPDLIFLDINMPRMNGWEFLERYRSLDPARKAKVVIIMLTTSLNPMDQERATRVEEVRDFETKPLSKEKLESIMRRFFPNVQG